MPRPFRRDPKAVAEMQNGAHSACHHLRLALGLYGAPVTSDGTTQLGTGL